MVTYALYLEQRDAWPQEGRHILAQYDEESVIVYQAYRPSIGHHAVEHQRFGGEWSFSRMSWIKPNFLWMMYRCGWASKDGQDVVLAIRLRRAGFDHILGQAVHSGFVPERYESREEWQQRVGASEVRLQWDPDHDPHGGKLERRAIQLGLRGSVLERYAKEWTISIEDISEHCRTQAEHVRARRLDALMTPAERVYPAPSDEVRENLGLQ
jgi:hypothetical protein